MPSATERRFHEENNPHGTHPGSPAGWSAPAARPKKTGTGLFIGPQEAEEAGSRKAGASRCGLFIFFVALDRFQDFFHGGHKLSGKNNGGIFLSRNFGHGLKSAELESNRMTGDHVSRLA